MSDTGSVDPNGDQQLRDIPRPSEADVAVTEWRTVVDAAASSEGLYDLAARFNAAGADALRRGEPSASNVFRSLADVCSLGFRSDAPDHPFHRRDVTGVFVLPGIEDLSDETIRACSSIAPLASNLRLRAHLADVAWTRNHRDAASARVAIETYLELAKEMQPDNWPVGLGFLDRSARIAGRLGRANPFVSKVVDAVERLLGRYGEVETGFMSAKLMDLVLAMGARDPERYGTLATNIAERFSSAADYHRAAEYFERAASWAGRRRDRAARRAALVAKAETYVSRAAAVVGENGLALMAAEHLHRAIETFRRAGGQRARIDEVHAMLLEAQQRAAQQIPTIRHSFDITEQVRAAEAAVTGRTLADALIALARMPALPDVRKLRATTEENVNRFVGKSLFSRVQLSSSGKVAWRAGSVRSRDEDEREEALRAEMFDTARIHQGYYAQALIEPARRRIIDEHPIRLDDLYSIVLDNPFVPPGREELFAEGLYAGFYGDLPKAAHLLILQLEHSIRILLHRHGVLVSGVTPESTQYEMNLNGILVDPSLRDILDDDVIFALQGLLVAKAGSDLRNRMAHGLMESADFWSDQVLYLWWLVFHLCMLPTLVQMSRRASTEGVAEDDVEESADEE